MHLERVGQTKGRSRFQPDEFDHHVVLDFLEKGPRRAVLVGAPGAGKSYALRRAAANLAEKLHESCLAEKFEQKDAIVPILADLKLYRGDLADLVNRSYQSE